MQCTCYFPAFDGNCIDWSSKRICYVYVYDILIMEKTFEEHLENIAKVLNWLQEAGLKLKPGKCHFLMKQVQYLRYTISD